MDGIGDVVARVVVGGVLVCCIVNEGLYGFGFVVRCGLDAFEGDVVVLVMVDGFDDLCDVLLYYCVLEVGYDCAFGLCFMLGVVVIDYLWLKLTINWFVN